MHEWYQTFDSFLFPSLYEGLGIVVIEAQCAGCYCLASTEIPQVAKVTKNLDFVNLNQAPKDWANYLLQPGVAVKVQKCELEVAEKGYDIKKEVTKIERFYLTSCGEGL